MGQHRESLYGELAACCLKTRIESKTETVLQASADFLFPESYVGFRGHFPTQPVLPAIVQLAMARYLAERCLGKYFLLQSCNRTKFRAMVQPQMKITVSLELHRDQLGWKGRFSLFKESGEAVASGGIELA